MTSIRLMIVAALAAGGILAGGVGAVLADPGNGQGAGQEKVIICHEPPGNPANAHEITVGSPAGEAHANHGNADHTADGDDLGVGCGED